MFHRICKNSDKSPSTAQAKRKLGGIIETIFEVKKVVEGLNA